MPFPAQHATDVVLTRQNEFSGFLFSVATKLLYPTVLPRQPYLGVELGTLPSELELQDVVTPHRAQRLSCGDLLAFGNADGGQVAIDGDVASVAHKDAPVTAGIEHCRHFSVVYGAGRRALSAEDVDAFVVKHYARKPLHAVLPEVTHYAPPGNRRRKTPFVVLELSAEGAIDA